MFKVELMSKLTVKTLVLNFLKFSGCFALCRKFFKDKLLILAYHGSELVDEASFNANLFMKPTTLQNRLNYLNKKGFNIIALDEALTRLQHGDLPIKAIVLTFDDGWHSTGQAAHPIMRQAAVPYTIYVTSYYVETQQPVLNVLLRYVFFKTQVNSIAASELDLAENQQISLETAAAKNSCFSQVLDKLLSYSDRTERETYVLKVATAFAVDLSTVLQERCFHLMTAQLLSQLAVQGVDLQLHTHKHNVDLGQLAALKQDLLQNKTLLKSYAGYTPQHFCYPSGVHDNRTEAVLREIGVLSATTCLPGFVTKKSNYYYLPRFLDGENISQLLFEAEVSGVLEAFRNLKHFVSSAFRR